MHIDADSDRCCKYSPGDTNTRFRLGSNFQPNRKTLTTGLSFVKTLGTRSERSLPVLMESSKIQ